MNLITGATGLLGSHIAEKLASAGEPVRVLVRPGSDTSFLDTLKVEKALGDVTEPASLTAAMQGVRTVYHAAAQVGDWGPWDRFVAVSIEGTRPRAKVSPSGTVSGSVELPPILWTVSRVA